MEPKGNVSPVPFVEMESIHQDDMNGFTIHGKMAVKTISLATGEMFKMTVSIEGIVDQKKFLKSFDAQSVKKMIEISKQMGLGSIKVSKKTKENKEVKAIQFSLDDKKNFIATKIFGGTIASKVLSQNYYLNKSQTPDVSEQKKVDLGKKMRLLNEVSIVLEKVYNDGGLHQIRPRPVKEEEDEKIIPPKGKSVEGQEKIENKGEKEAPKKSIVNPDAKAEKKDAEKKA